MASFEVRGAGQLHALAKRLRAQEPQLKRDLTRNIRLAAKPAGDRATRKLAAATPGGALEESVRRQRTSVSVRTGPRTAGVRVGAGKKGSAMRTLDQKGEVRHLVFGRPGSWVVQPVPGARGLWAKSMQSERLILQVAVAKAMGAAARRIVGG